MFPTIEIHAPAEVNQANRLFNNILKLKKERKEKQEKLKDYLSADEKMQALEEQMSILKLEQRMRKKELMNSGRAGDLNEDIKELSAEIKNDSEILKDHALVAVTKGVQLSLFDEETQEKYFPEFNISLKRK